MLTADAARAFLVAKETRGMSPRTLQSHRYRLNVFGRMCPTLPTEPEPLEAFLHGGRHLGERGILDSEKPRRSGGRSPKPGAGGWGGPRARREELGATFCVCFLTGVPHLPHQLVELLLGELRRHTEPSGNTTQRQERRDWQFTIAGATRRIDTQNER